MSIDTVWLYIDFGLALFVICLIGYFQISNITKPSGFNSESLDKRLLFEGLTNTKLIYTPSSINTLYPQLMKLKKDNQLIDYNSFLKKLYPNIIIMYDEQNNWFIVDNR